jgi:cardiolipin synthase
MQSVNHGSVLLPIWLLALLVIVIVALLVVVWSVKRRRRPNLEHAGDGSAALEAMLSGLLQSTVVGGNAVELLQNGAFFERFFADLDAASTSINIETFLSKHGEITRRLTDILVRKRADGVEVRLLLDGSGGRGFGRADVKRLREAGCRVERFHRLTLRNLGILNQRTHRKIAITDGRLGYVGGHCLVDTWLGDAEDKEHFRDITARVRGPVVNQLQSTFTDNWIEETGEVIAGEKFFPRLEPCGESSAHIVFVSPTGGPSTLKLLHYLAIKEAKQSIIIQNPYFLPDPDARQALLEAVRRGVDVRIMIPDTAATDAKLVSHASHHHYGTLLKGGIRIFDYQRTLLHQKVFTIDHQWASIGSTNFDDRSFEINDEVSLVVHDAGVARALEETFERDLRHARERHFEEWSKRPAPHKLVDGCAFLLNEQL